MNATLEMLHDAPGRPQAVGVLRIGPEHGTILEPFCWACTVIWRNQSMVELLGCIRAPDFNETRALVECLRMHSVDVIQEIRITENNRVVYHKL